MKAIFFLCAGFLLLKMGFDLNRPITMTVGVLLLLLGLLALPSWLRKNFGSPDINDYQDH